MWVWFRPLRDLQVAQGDVTLAQSVGGGSGVTALRKRTVGVIGYTDDVRSIEWLTGCGAGVAGCLTVDGRNGTRP